MVWYGGIGDRQKVSITSIVSTHAVTARPVRPVCRTKLAQNIFNSIMPFTRLPKPLSCCPMANIVRRECYFIYAVDHRLEIVTIIEKNLMWLDIENPGGGISDLPFDHSQSGGDSGAAQCRRTSSKMQRTDLVDIHISNGIMLTRYHIPTKHR